MKTKLGSKKAKKHINKKMVSLINIFVLSRKEIFSYESYFDKHNNAFKLINSFSVILKINLCYRRKRTDNLQKSIYRL